MAMEPVLAKEDAAAVLAAWNSLWPPREDFRFRLAAELLHLVAADLVTVNGFNIRTGERDLAVAPAESDAVVRELREQTNDILSQHPVAKHFLESGRTDAIRLSDCLPLDQWRATELYRHYYEKLGLTWEIVIPIPTRGGQVNIITVHSRAGFEDPAADFSQRHLDLCTAMVPIATLGCGGLPDDASDAWKGMADGWYLVRFDDSRRITHVSPPDPHGDLVPGVKLPDAVRQQGRFPESSGAAANWTTQFVGGSDVGHIVAMKRRGANTDVSALTPRQREVLVLVAEGRTNSQIATALGISEGTVRKHVEAILAGLGASNRAAAAAMWLAARE